VIRAIALCGGFNLEDMAKLNAQALLDSFDPKPIGGTVKPSIESGARSQTLRHDHSGRRPDAGKREPMPFVRRSRSR
jgi:hypothetical protein